MTLVLASAIISTPSSSGATPRFSSAFCSGVGQLYASPQYIATHWPTLNTSRATLAQGDRLDATLSSYGTTDFAVLGQDGPSKYRALFSTIDRSAVAELGWANLFSGNFSTRKSPRNESKWTIEIKADAGLIRRDLTRVAATMAHACSTFNDVPIAQTAATYLTENSNNTARNLNRPLSATVIDHVAANFFHLIRLVHVTRQLGQITTVTYRVAAIVGYDTICTNNPGWDKNPLPVTC
jgi:hypothetical protein